MFFYHHIVLICEASVVMQRLSYPSETLSNKMNRNIVLENHLDGDLMYFSEVMVSYGYVLTFESPRQARNIF